MNRKRFDAAWDKFFDLYFSFIAEYDAYSTEITVQRTKFRVVLYRDTWMSSDDLTDPDLPNCLLYVCKIELVDPDSVRFPQIIEAGLDNQIHNAYLIDIQEAMNFLCDGGDLANILTERIMRPVLRDYKKLMRAAQSLSKSVGNQHAGWHILRWMESNYSPDKPGLKNNCLKWLMFESED